MANRSVTRSMSSELQARHQQQFQSPYNKGISDLLNEAGAPLFNVPEANPVLRNTSEEIFIKSIVEGTLPAPNMEGMGFTSLPNAIRADSEELFHSWMSHGEGQNSIQAPASQRPRQASRRMSNELAGILGQQLGQNFNRTDSFDHFLQANVFFSDEGTTGENRNNEEAGASPNKPPSQKPLLWFSQPHPMTRSRSSELRRRYAAMHGRPPPAESMSKPRRAPAQADMQPMESSNKRANEQSPFPQHVSQESGLSYPIPLSRPGDSVSNFVSLLKGTIERKKLATAVQSPQQQQVLDSCSSQQAFENLQRRVDGSMFQGMGQMQQEGSAYQGMGHMQQEGSPYCTSSPLQLGGMGHMQQEAYGQVHSMGRNYSEGPSQPENFNTTNNSTSHPGLLSHAPSPSESSAGGPGLSAGEDPCNSGHTNSSDIRQPSKRRSAINGPIGLGNGKSVGDGISESDISNKSQLPRAGSFTSSGGSGLGLEKEDPTKKRRVERQRKMAEAKGRGSVPMLPSDLQAALKRCDNLEKEVRSLKLNLSFMNRKDSEQTKQIEELQKQNERLQEEKERLLDEIEQLSTGAYLA